jgi:hypothetical protein
MIDCYRKQPQEDLNHRSHRVDHGALLYASLRPSSDQKTKKYVDTDGHCYKYYCNRRRKASSIRCISDTQ